MSLSPVSTSSLLNKIRSQVRSELSGLNGLGDRIRQRVSEQLATQLKSQTSSDSRSTVRTRYLQDGFDGPSRGTVPQQSSPRPSQPRQTTPTADPDAVAQKLAREATGYTYDYSGGKTWSQTLGNEDRFDGSKSGVCADMALEAAQRFEAHGVEARVAYGRTARGNHAWVEYKDASGNWKMFDPTAAASTKNAQDAITPRDNGLYGYGSVFSRYDAPGER